MAAKKKTVKKSTRKVVKSVREEKSGLWNILFIAAVALIIIVVTFR